MGLEDGCACLSVALSGMVLFGDGDPGLDALGYVLGRPFQGLGTACRAPTLGLLRGSGDSPRTGIARVGGRWVEVPEGSVRLGGLFGSVDLSGG